MTIETIGILTSTEFYNLTIICYTEPTKNGIKKSRTNNSTITIFVLDSTKIY